MKGNCPPSRGHRFKDLTYLSVLTVDSNVVQSGLLAGSVPGKKLLGLHCITQ